MSTAYSACVLKLGYEDVLRPGWFACWIMAFLGKRLVLDPKRLPRFWCDDDLKSVTLQATILLELAGWWSSWKRAFGETVNTAKPFEFSLNNTEIYTSGMVPFDSSCQNVANEVRRQI